MKVECTFYIRDRLGNFSCENQFFLSILSKNFDQMLKHINWFAVLFLLGNYPMLAQVKTADLIANLEKEALNLEARQAALQMIWKFCA